VKAELLLVRDRLEGAAPWMAQVLREAGFRVRTTSAAELGDVAPAEVVLLRIADRNPTATCWNLHRQGYRWIVAVSGSPNSQECIRLLNAGADYYIDAWLPAAELVARVNVVLRFSAWLAESYDPAALSHQSIPKTAERRTG
jgi:DNA-binding response OmpR family regulator